MMQTSAQAYKGTGWQLMANDQPYRIVPPLPAPLATPRALTLPSPIYFPFLSPSYCAWAVLLATFYREAESKAAGSDDDRAGAPGRREAGAGRSAKVGHA